MIDQRFPTTLLIMLSLAKLERQGYKSVSSSELADGLAINPALMRKLLASLVRRGLVVSKMGRSGGVSLSRPADQITLRDIYLASVEDKKLWSARTGVPKACFVTNNFEEYFDSINKKADGAILKVLADQTLESDLSVLNEIGNTALV